MDVFVLVPGPFQSSVGVFVIGQAFEPSYKQGFGRLAVSHVVPQSVGQFQVLIARNATFHFLEKIFVTMCRV